jgi:peptidoglycan L-alanyl-D-glutamate endopeptidase CwlK
MNPIDTLHPVFRWQLQKVLDELTKLGWKPIVASGVRTRAQQAKKVKQGYSKTMNSWHVQGVHQLLPFGKDAVEVVNGAAADVVDKRYGWGGLAANRHFRFWKDLGRIAKKHGLEWGGDWKKFPDVAHVQMRFVESRPQKTAVA